MIIEQKAEPLVSIIIVNFNGKNCIEKCLNSLGKQTYHNFEIIVVDNASTDGSDYIIEKHFPHVNLIKNRENLGFSGGINIGINFAKAKYIVCLNNDVVVEDNWLDELIKAVQSSPNIGIVGSKIKNISDKQKFDYSGACGGFIDLCGYPFCRGRIFNTLEKDTHQYDDGLKDVFWVSGASLLVKKDILPIIGFFDEDYFMYNEEIDLCWRALKAGFRVVINPLSVAYHEYKPLIEKMSKNIKNNLIAYYEYRNELITLIKNSTMPMMFFLRILFDILSMFYWLSIRKSLIVAAILKAYLWIIFNLRSIMLKRKKSQKVNQKIGTKMVKERIYKGIIAIEYFIKRRITYHEITK